MIPHKITRICWNTNNWIMPSGNKGKSKNINSFENEAGFGLDEWLFDFSKVVDGYIYGYVPAARTNQILPPIHKFDLSLYSIENKKSEKYRWWIGTIYEVELIHQKKSIEIYNIYEEKGWLKERLNQLDSLQIEYTEFINDFPNTFFNIRFKLKNIQLLDTPIAFSHKDPAIKSNYYNFLDFKQLPLNVLATESTNIQLQTEIFYREAYSVEAKSFNKLHSIIGNQLLQQLQSQNTENYKIFSEFNLENNTRIDIMLETISKQYIIYEIKIARNLREVLRQSLGQLLEYAFHLTYTKIEKLIIVSTFDLDAPQHEKEKEFLAFLNINFNIPVSYEYIDIQNS